MKVQVSAQAIASKMQGKRGKYFDWDTKEYSGFSISSVGESWVIVEIIFERKMNDLNLMGIDNRLNF